MKQIPKDTKNYEYDIWQRIKINPSGCWLWQTSLDKDGYGIVCIHGKYYRASRVVYFLSHGYDPGKLLVLHTCDTPACCCPDHLFLGTDADNARDKKAKGRSMAGELHPRVKLTDTQILTIRKSRKSLLILSKQHGVSRAYLSLVQLGRYRKSAGGPLRLPQRGRRVFRG
jgi:hypothetical protein